MNRRNCSLVFLVIGALAVQANAAVTITQGPTAPTYSTTLNFDEPGGPTGANVPNNSWAGAPYNIIEFQSGEGTNSVGDNNVALTSFATSPNSTNSYYGPFGVFIRFASDLTELSFNAWDPSGPPSPFGGGMVIFLINDGDEDNPVGAEAFTPAFSGVGDPAFNITTTAGTVFDEVRILGNGFPADTYVDDLSWNVVPEPSCGLFLAAGTLLLSGWRRRVTG